MKLGPSVTSNRVERVGEYKARKPAPAKLPGQHAGTALEIISLEVPAWLEPVKMRDPVER